MSIEYNIIRKKCKTISNTRADKVNNSSGTVSLWSGVKKPQMWSI